MTTTIQERSRGSGVILAAFVLAGLAGLWTPALCCLERTTHLREAWPPEADTFYLPPSSALRVAGLRHNELLADLIHARANVYFGTQMHARVPTKWLPQYLDAALHLDPKFQRLYFPGAGTLVYK